MPDVVKLKFAYKLHSILKLTGEACLKNALFCNIAFFGIKESKNCPKKLNNDSLFLLKIKN